MLGRHWRKGPFLMRVYTCRALYPLPLANLPLLAAARLPPTRERAAQALTAHMEAPAQTPHPA